MEPAPGDGPFSDLPALAATGEAPGTTPAPRAALVALATALDPRDYAITLTAPPGGPPRLTVTNRHAQISDVIRADHQAFYWSWGEPIGPLGDPPAAAGKVSTVLHATPQPSHG
jgi:hypothetical protein